MRPTHRQQTAEDPSSEICVAMVVNAWGAEKLGGAERQLASLYPLLSRRGIRPIIIARKRSGTRGPIEDSEDVIRVRVPGVAGLDQLWFFVGAMRALTSVRPDVVHAFGAFSQSAIAAVYRRRTGTPFLTKILRSGELGDLHRLRNKRFGRWRTAHLARNAAAFVAISDDIDAELAAIGVEPERRLRIPNGVDLDRFRPAVDSGPGDELRAELGRSGPIVVAVGRMSPEKRMRELSERWHIVRRSFPDATLAIYGKLVNRVDPSSVRLHNDPGVVALGARSDVESGYRSADIYVSASTAEGLSNALLEAMASGLPCVVTDVGGVRDVIQNRANGVVVGVDDLDGLVNEIIALLGDASSRQDVGRRARETVAARFGLETVADNLARAYRQIASTASTR